MVGILQKQEEQRLLPKQFLVTYQHIHCMLSGLLRHLRLHMMQEAEKWMETVVLHMILEQLMARLKQPEQDMYL